MIPPISELPPVTKSSNNYAKTHVKKFPSCKYTYVGLCGSVRSITDEISFILGSFPSQNTSNDLWFVGRNINLYFDIPELQKSDNSMINNVIVGELRLYKLPVKVSIIFQVFEEKTSEWSFEN